MKWTNSHRPGNDRADYAAGSLEIRPTYRMARRVGCPNQFDGWAVFFNGEYVTCRTTLAKAKAAAEKYLNHQQHGEEQ